MTSAIEPCTLAVPRQGWLPSPSFSTMSCLEAMLQSHVTSMQEQAHQTAVSLKKSASVHNQQILTRIEELLRIHDMQLAAAQEASKTEAVIEVEVDTEVTEEEDTNSQSKDAIEGVENPTQSRFESYTSVLNCRLSPTLSDMKDEALSQLPSVGRHRQQQQDPPSSCEHSTEGNMTDQNQVPPATAVESENVEGSKLEKLDTLETEERSSTESSPLQIKRAKSDNQGRFTGWERTKLNIDVNAGRSLIGRRENSSSNLSQKRSRARFAAAIRQTSSANSSPRVPRQLIKSKSDSRMQSTVPFRVQSSGDTNEKRVIDWDLLDKDIEQDTQIYLSCPMEVKRESKREGKSSGSFTETSGSISAREVSEPKKTIKKKSLSARSVSRLVMASWRRKHAMATRSGLYIFSNRPKEVKDIKHLKKADRWTSISLSNLESVYLLKEEDFVNLLANKLGAEGIVFVCKARNRKDPKRVHMVYLKSNVRTDIAQMLLTLDGLCTSAFDHSVVDSYLRVVCLKMLYKDSYKDVVIKGPNQQWEYIADRGLLKSKDGSIATCYKWNGEELTPLDNTVASYGSGTWNGITIKWMCDAYEDALTYYYCSPTMDYYQDGNLSLRHWYWESRTLRSTANAEMTWTVEPEAVIVPEPLVMFCVLLEDAFHQLSSLAYAKH